jgi:hypothetical protein
MLLFAPSLWPLFAPREIPFGPSLARRSTAQVTPLSRRLLTTTEALTSRRASLRPFGLCLIALLIPPALRPCGMNTINSNATRSPQVRRFSFPPCRPHTPCLKARCASISFALKAAGSVKRARGRPVRLWLKPRLWPGDSTHALRIPSRDGHPALHATLIPGPPVCPAFCLRIPLARVRRDFHPLEKRPAGRTTLIRHYSEAAQAMSPYSRGQ